MLMRDNLSLNLTTPLRRTIVNKQQSLSEDYLDQLAYEMDCYLKRESLCNVLCNLSWEFRILLRGNITNETF